MKFKKIVSVAIFGIFMVSSSLTSFAYTNPVTPLEIASVDVNDVILQNDQTITLPDGVIFTDEGTRSLDVPAPIKMEPRTNYLIVSGASINNGYGYWDQPSNYNSYRISVTNTGSQAITTKISYGGSSTVTLSIPANSERNTTVNNAWSSRHNVDFSSSNGTVKGSYNVRVSDVSQ